jgi:hypothetical protein
MVVKITTNMDGTFKAFADDTIRRAGIVVRHAVDLAGQGAKLDLRQAVTGVGLSNRLANTITNKTYPASGGSLKAAAWIAGRGQQAELLLGLFSQGAVIRANQGLYLAIPLPAAGRVAAYGGQGRLTPGVFERRTGLRLRFVYRPGKPSLLVADSKLTKGGRASRTANARLGAASVPVFLLVPQVRVPQKFDTNAIVQKWANSVPGLIESLLPAQIK